MVYCTCVHCICNKVKFEGSRIQWAGFMKEMNNRSHSKTMYKLQSTTEHFTQCITSLQTSSLISYHVVSHHLSQSLPSMLEHPFAPSHCRNTTLRLGASMCTDTPHHLSTFLSIFFRTLPLPSLHLPSLHFRPSTCIPRHLALIP